MVRGKAKGIIPMEDLILINYLYSKYFHAKPLVMARGKAKGFFPMKNLHF